MIFPTVEFAAFFAVVLCLSWALMPRPTLWKPFILVASYVFYGYADWRFVALLVSSTLLNQTAALGITRSVTRRGRKSWLVAAVAVNLGLLGVFKYLGFFVDSVDRFLTGIGLDAPLPLLHVVLPIGISFFTFQAISYVADVHSGLIKPSPAARLRDLRGVLPAPHRRADRPGPRVPAPAGSPARPLGDPGRPGALPHRRWADQEGRDRRPARYPPRRPRVRRPARALRPGVARRDLRLRRADLLRLLGLHRHGDRAGAAPGLPVPAELQPPVHRRFAAGLLASLAHDPVPLAARLPVRPARRQPSRAG